MISLKNTLKAISSKFSALNTLLNDVPHYTLLWTNPNPTSSFSAQTISLDLSKYDAVEITFKSSGITTIRSDIDGKSREANYIESSGVGYIQAKRRGYTTSSTGISFGKGYWNFGAQYPWNETSDACVPYKIYGIKFGGGIRLSVLSSLRRWLYAKFESYLKSDWGEHHHNQECLGRKGNEVYGIWNANFVVVNDAKLHRSMRWFAGYEYQIRMLPARKYYQRRRNESLEGETESRFICRRTQCNSSSSFQRLKNLSLVVRKPVISLCGIYSFRLMPKEVFA